MDSAHALILRHKPENLVLLRFAMVFQTSDLIQFQFSGEHSGPLRCKTPHFLEDMCGKKLKFYQSGNKYCCKN